MLRSLSCGFSLLVGALLRGKESEEVADNRLVCLRQPMGWDTAERVDIADPG